MLQPLIIISNSYPSKMTTKNPNTLTSRWSINTNDYQQHATQHFQLYPPIPPCAYLNWFKKQQTFQKNPYYIGDPLFFGESLEAYEFLELTNNSTHHRNRLLSHTAEFRSPQPTYPPPIIHLKLHERITYKEKPSHLLSYT